MYISQKKLITIFKSFFEKACLPLVKQHMPVLKQWLYFSSMLSQQTIDIQRIQRYIQNLNTVYSNLSLSETNKNFTLPNSNTTDFSTGSFRNKKIQNKDNRFNYPPSYSSSITIGQPIFNLNSRMNPISLSRQQIMVNSKSSFKLSDQQITKPMASKLNCLYMTFMDNQHKIQFPKKEADLNRRFSDMHEMITR